MKTSTITLAACALFATSLAVAEERDTGGSAERDDVDEGPGGTRLAFDLDYANGLEPDVGAGIGGAVRFGREYDLVLLSLTPEFMGSLHSLPEPNDLLPFAAMAGGKASIGKIIEPGVFAHVGAGHVNLPVDSLTGFAFDVGLALDLTLIPALDLGVHGAYDAITWGNEGTFDWYRLGAHIALAP